MQEQTFKTLLVSSPRLNHRASVNIRRLPLPFCKASCRKVFRLLVCEWGGGGGVFHCPQLSI